MESCLSIVRRSWSIILLRCVQDLRDKKQVPGGLQLHQYANLYFHARNPMLFKRLNEVDSLCVLRVSKQVLAIAGAVITDQNAASDYVRFLDPSQWKLLPFDDIYAEDWRHPNDPIAYWKHKARKCAEVLVPNLVDPKFVTGAYVVDAAAAARLMGLGFAPAVTVDRVLFFR
jgi:ssDNA thymidine ADP-ribosyltransferase, DarT